MSAPQLGINISAPSNFTGDMHFADGTRSAGEGFQLPQRLNFARNPDGSDILYPAPLDANGWPTTDCEIAVAAGTEPGGTWHLQLVGYADVRPFQGDVSCTDLNGVALAKDSGGNVHSYDAGTNTTDILLAVPAGETALFVTLSNTRRSPGDAAPTGFTGFRLMRPVDLNSSTPHPTSEAWHRGFLAATSFADVRRFMDPLQINNTPPGITWETRTRPGHPNQADPQKGMALELCVAMCNATNSDLWFNVPDVACFATAAEWSNNPATALASCFTRFDEYCRNAANAVIWGSNGVDAHTGVPGPVTASNPNPQPAGGVPAYPGLNPDLSANAELSNETWNVFPQGARYINLRAANAGPGDPIHYDGSTDGTLVPKRGIVPDTVRMSANFRSVLGDVPMQTRMKVILGCQDPLTDPTASNSVLPLLKFLDGYYNNAAGNFVANPKPPSYHIWAVCTGSYRQTNLHSTSDGPDAAFGSGLFAQNHAGAAAVARNFGVNYTNYEVAFGQGEATPNPTFDAINNDPRAQAAETTVLQDCFNAGSRIVNHYNTTILNWKLWQDIFTAKSGPLPKHLAMLAMSNRGGAGVTATLAAPPIANQSFFRGVQGFGQGDVLDIETFTFPSGGGILEYSLRGHQAGTAPTIGFRVDGVQVATATLPDPNLAGISEGRVRVLVPIGAGIHTVGINAIAAGTLTYNESITLTWNPPIDQGNVLASDDFTTHVADGADIATEANSAWSYTGQGTPIVSDHARGGCRLSTGGAGNQIVLYKSSLAPASADYSVETTMRGFGDGYRFYVAGRVPPSILGSDGHSSGYSFGVEYGALYLRGPNGSGGSKTLANIATTTTSGLPLDFRLEFRGASIRGLVGGFEVVSVTDTQLTAAGSAVFGCVAGQKPSAADATLFTGFKATNLAPGGTIAPINPVSLYSDAVRRFYKPLVRPKTGP